MPPDTFEEALRKAGATTRPQSFEEALAASASAPRDFDSWYAGHAKRHGLDPNPDASEHKYDYRAAFRSGDEPDETGHWPSRWKADDHPNRFVDGQDTKTSQPANGPPGMGDLHMREAQEEERRRSEAPDAGWRERMLMRVGAMPAFDAPNVSWEAMNAGPEAVEREMQAYRERETADAFARTFPKLGTPKTRGEVEDAMDVLEVGIARFGHLLKEDDPYWAGVKGVPEASGRGIRGPALRLQEVARLARTHNTEMEKAWSEHRAREGPLALMTETASNVVKNLTFGAFDPRKVFMDEGQRASLAEDAAAQVKRGGFGAALAKAVPEAASAFGSIGAATKAVGAGIAKSVERGLVAQGADPVVAAVRAAEHANRLASPTVAALFGAQVTEGGAEEKAKGAGLNSLMVWLGGKAGVMLRDALADPRIPVALREMMAQGATDALATYGTSGGNVNEAGAVGVVSAVLAGFGVKNPLGRFAPSRDPDLAGKVKADAVAKGLARPEEVYSPERLDVLAREGPAALAATPPLAREDGSVAAATVPTQEALAGGLVEAGARPAVERLVAEGGDAVSSGVTPEGKGFAIGVDKRGETTRVEAPAPSTPSGRFGAVAPADVEATAARIRGAPDPHLPPEAGAFSPRDVVDLAANAAGVPRKAISAVLDSGDWLARQAGKGLGKVPGVRQAIAKAKAGLKEVGDFIGLRPGEYVNRVAEHAREIALGRDDANRAVMELERPLDDDGFDLAAGYFTKGRSGRQVDRGEAVKTLGEEYVALLDQHRADFDAGMREIQRLGGMSPETLAEWEGVWLPRLYRQHFEEAGEKVTGLGKAGKRKPEMHLRLDKPTVTYREGGKARFQRFASMEDAQAFAQAAKRDATYADVETHSPISAERRAEMGEIRDVPTLIARGHGLQRTALANLRLLDRVAQTPEWVSDTEQRGFLEMPADKKRYGALAGKWVKAPVARDIKGFFGGEDGGILEKAAKIADVMLTQWKFGKTVLNPATHARNLISNAIFTEFDGFSFLDPSNWQDYIRAQRVMRATNGDDLALRRYFIQEGVMSGDFLSTEVLRDLDGIMRTKGATPAERFNNYWGEKARLAGQGRALEALPGAGSMASAYRIEEILPKVAAALHKIRKGMTPEQATAEVRKRYVQPDTAATQALYRKRGLGGAALRQALPPFLTFTTEATRILAHYARTKPVTTAAFILGLKAVGDASMDALGITGEERERFESGLPKWLKPSTTNLVLPFRWNGKVVALDLSWTVPLGNDLTSDSILGIQIGRGEDAAAAIGNTVIRNLGPLVKTTIEAGTGQNLFTGRPIKKGGVASHVGEQLLPPLTPGVGRGFKKMRDAAPGDDSTRAMLQYLLGVTVRPLEGRRGLGKGPKRKR